MYLTIFSAKVIYFSDLLIIFLFFSVEIVVIVRDSEKLCYAEILQENNIFTTFAWFSV